MHSRWSYGECLTEAQAFAVRAYAEKIKAGRGTVGRQSGNVDTAIRDSGIRWLKRSDENLRWLFDIVDRRVHDFNCDFHFIRHRYDGMDSFQYTEYGPGEFYGKHTDAFIDEGGIEQRKVSCSVLLSDPAEFEGGTLVVGGGHLRHEDQHIGQISVFPSVIEHEVRPVTKGKRVSLVGWYKGPPWI